MPPLRRQTVLLATVVLCLTACAPANERPLRGAVPGTEAPTPAGLPPTLSPSDSLRLSRLPTPSPGVIAGPAAQASPSAAAQASPSAAALQPPIVRTINPANNSHVTAAQPVTFSAVLVGRTADLASASLSVNGADAGAQIDKHSPRDWTIHSSRKLAGGTYTVKVLVRDAQGTAGGFTWQILVGEEETPTPAQ